MSAIVGIYYRDGKPVERETLGRMVDILAHRGPDGADVWCEGSVGLGHRMLWTTPESLLEKLPLANQTGDLVITADARIDNRDELIPQLKLDIFPKEKVTDSQIILAAYEKWGESCPEKLLGDFAFAIWDGQKQQLFCARDHFGIKPFHYCYQSGKAFLFASEIKALVCLPEILRRLNEVRIADYLYPMMEDKSITSYQGIFRLPPAHILIVNYEGNFRLDCYWSLEPTGDELRLNCDREYAEAFREIFTEAVGCRLRSAFPVGSHLSGGLDSSSITCVARNIITQSELHTFSNIFDDVPECDERKFINSVLDQGGFIPHYIHADRIGPLSEWQHFFQYEDEAFIGPSHFLPWGLNRAAHQTGVRIVLDGFDGDTTVSHGALYFRELANQGKWATFVSEANAVSQHFDTSPSAILRCYGFTYLEELSRHFRWLAFANAVNQINQYFQVSRKHLWFNYGLKPLIPQSVLQLFCNPNKSLNDHLSLINDCFAQKMGMKERIHAYKFLKNSSTTVREEQWCSLTSGLFTLTLELIDRTASAFSLESRHPFMDKRLIEFCLALPAEQKLNRGWSRMVMRRAMQEILPEQIQWRGGKTKMTPNFLRGLFNFDKEILEEALVNDKDRIREFVNLQSLNCFYHRLISAKKVRDEELMTVWKAITLALWLRHTQIRS